MKIKKKKYKRELDRKYWEGVDDGIEFALDNPAVVQWRKKQKEIVKAGNSLQQACGDLGARVREAFSKMEGLK